MGDILSLVEIAENEGDNEGAEGESQAAATTQEGEGKASAGNSYENGVSNGNLGEAPKTGNNTISVVAPDGQEIVIPKSGKFTHLVDGESVEFSIADVLSAASGEAAIRKRMGQLGADKQKIDQQRAAIASSAQGMVDAIQSGDITKLAKAAADLLGVDARPIVGGFYKNAKDSLSEYMDMTETERRAKDLEIENELLQEGVKRQTESTTKTQKATEVTNIVTSTMERYGLSDAEFLAAHDEASALAKNGQLTEAQITAINSLSEKNKYTASKDLIEQGCGILAQLASNTKTLNIIRSVISNENSGLEKDNPELYNVILEDAYYEINHPNPRQRITTAEALQGYIKKRAAEAKPNQDSANSVSVTRERQQSQSPVTPRAQVDLEKFEDDEWRPYSS